jgi:lipid-binding SYLF domain-containing protein
MYFAGAGGSGVVIARLPDGTWSPPSAFSVRSGSFGLVYGVDVYDCVCVLNTQEAVNAYTQPEMNLGNTVAVAAGPLGGTPDVQGKEVKPVWTYTKSKGLYGGLTVDGTVIKEKPDANAEFYGQKVTTAQILSGEVKAQSGASRWPAGSSQLTEVLKRAEGKGADEQILQGMGTEPTPGDLTQ